MQRSLRTLLHDKEKRVATGAVQTGAQGPNGSAAFTSEEIMIANLHCVRPCYANNASGVGPAAEVTLALAAALWLTVITLTVTVTQTLRNPAGCRGGDVA